MRMWVEGSGVWWWWQAGSGGEVNNVRGSKGVGAKAQKMQVCQHKNLVNKGQW